MDPLTIGGLCVILLLVYKYIIAPAFVSPLSRIPNAHPTASILPLWIWWIRRTGTETRSIFALHRKHGPVVRLGPNEISVNSIDGLRTIYVGGFEKHHWYRDLFVNYQTPNLISTLERKPHSRQKRVISNVYSKSYLHNSPDMQKLSRIVILDRFLPLLHSIALSSAAVDVLELAQSVAMDMISGYIFGSANGTNFLQDVEARIHWRQEYAVFKTQNPREHAGGEIEQSCMAMCNAAAATLKGDQEKVAETATKPVVYEQLSRDLECSGSGQSESKTLIVASELLDHLIAGHETSGITLTYIMYEMSRHPSLQSRLREELLTLPQPLLVSPTITPPESTDTSYSQLQRSIYHHLNSPRDLDALSLLDAILQETLRLYQPVPAPQPRITPYSSPPISLDGFANILGGVRISSNAYTLHRNPEVFPYPEAWTPERWLTADKTQKDEMKRWFWAFGSGGRMCLGSNFAIQNIKLIIAAIYTNFATFIVDDHGIEQADTYVAGPVSNKLILRFQPVI